MKKFLIYLAVIVVMVATGFTIFVLVRDDEYMELPTSTMYVNIGDSFKVNFVHNNPKGHTKVKVHTTDGKLEYDESTKSFTALSAGKAAIQYETNNIKFGTLTCYVIIGDGESAGSPFYIQTVEQLAMIGKVVSNNADGTANYVYGPDKYYSLQNNINIGETFEDNQTGYWVPLCSDEAFTGVFEGNGYTLSNMRINGDSYNKFVKDTNINGIELPFNDVGLFEQIGEGGKVQNVMLDNVTITGDYDNAGAVAGVNNGTIERVGVRGLNVNYDTTTAGAAAFDGNFGGITGTNNSRVDRAFVEIGSLGFEETNIAGEVTKHGLAGNIGGLVGLNNSAIIINSYVRQPIEKKLDGSVEKTVTGVYVTDNSSTAFGGIVGKLTHTDGQNDEEGTKSYVKNTYAMLKIDNLNVDSQAKIGLIAGISELKNNAEGEQANYLFGNYYRNDMNTSFTAFGDADDSAKDSDTGKEYIGAGLTKDQMRVRTNYVSNLDVNDIEVLWFSTGAWLIDGTYTQNDGYPYISTRENKIPDNFVKGDKVDTITEMTPDGNYVIDHDVTIDETWPFWDVEFNGHITFENGAALVGDPDKTYSKPLFRSLSEDATLTNITVRDYEFVAAPSAENDTAELAIIAGQNAGRIEGAILENCSITVNVTDFETGDFENAPVEALFVSGICATNRGTIINSKIIDTEIVIDNHQSVTVPASTTTQTPTPAAAFRMLGEDGTTSTEEPKTEQKTVNDLTPHMVYAGLVAATNESTIDDIMILGTSSVTAEDTPQALIDGVVIDKQVTGTDGNPTTTKITYRDLLNVYLGGIAGSSKGSISNCYSMASVSAGFTQRDDKTVKKVAGGIVGLLNNNQFENTANVVACLERCGVTSAALEGYYVGGLIGENANAGNGYNHSIGVKVDVYDNQNSDCYDVFKVTYDVKYCYVDNSTIEGRYAGGLIAITNQNGSFLNCYVDEVELKGADLEDSNWTSVTAGFVAVTANFRYVRPSEGGALFRNTVFAGCYSTAKFSDNAGTKYLLAPGSQILNMPQTMFWLAKWVNDTFGLNNAKDSILITDSVYVGRSNASIDSLGTGWCYCGDRTDFTSFNDNEQVVKAFSGRAISNTSKYNCWIYSREFTPRLIDVKYFNDQTNLFQ